MTPEGKTFLIKQEGLRTKIYKDSAGLPTIGVGHLLTKDELSSGKIRCAGFVFDIRDKELTEDQCIILMEQDLKPSMFAVMAYVLVPLKSHQRDALESFVFNVGRDAFQKSTLLKNLNTGDYASVPSQLARWVHAGGQLSNGLAMRRLAEVKLWKGSYV